MTTRIVPTTIGSTAIPAGPTAVTRRTDHRTIHERVTTERQAMATIKPHREFKLPRARFKLPPEESKSARCDLAGDSVIGC